MAMIEVKSDPTRWDLRVFAVLWLVFFVILARVVLRAGNEMFVAAAFTATCLLVSMVFNTELPRRKQLAGAAIPIVLFALGLAARTLDPTMHRAIVWAFASIGVAGALIVFASRRAGRALYRSWMFAVLPIGWTVSHVLLATVFFGVITPIGLLMRALGRDPMERSMDRSRTSYWTPRKQPTDTRQYLRQS